MTYMLRGVKQKSGSSPLWRARTHPLDAIFQPKTVAIIGATDKPGSVGCAVRL